MTARAAAFLWLLPLLLLVPQTASSQSSFSRNDAFDFRGDHALLIGGTGTILGMDPDHFTLSIANPIDFRLFRIHVRTGHHVSSHWWLNKVKIDMDADGTWEFETTQDDAVAAYSLPEPANGISATHTVRVELQFIDVSGAASTRTTTYPITILAAPRVFADVDDNSFIQVRNEDCTNKIPVLLVEGFDPLNQSFAADYYISARDLVESDLYNPSLAPGYEVFILNFRYGGRDMRLNSAVLVKALERIRSICPNYEIALAGLSMGGTISRYTLAKLESQSIAHHVGLFVSYDSPQRWAHVSQDLQDFISNQPANVVGPLQSALQADAAKQLLDYNTYDPFRVQRNSFFNELDALNGDGYPHQSYNAAISNGTLSATWPGHLYESLATLKSYTDGQSYTPTDVRADEADCGPGSMSINLTRTLYEDLLPSWLFWKSAYLEFKIYFNPVFITTQSSLHLTDVHQDSLLNITSYASSHFDDFGIQTAPLMHNQVSSQSRTKIMGWLNKTSNFNISYTLLEGGSTNPETFQVRVLGGTSVTIQPKTVSVEGRQIVYQFLRWDDGNTANPRVFAAPRNTSRGVVMKAHLASASSGVAANNQARIVDASTATNSTQHVVYESDGMIWQSRRPQSGAWEPERLLSYGPNDHDPTIIAHKFNSTMVQVHTAWFRDDYIFYREHDPGSGLPVGLGSYYWLGCDGREAILVGPRCDRVDSPSPCYPALMWVDGGAGIWVEQGLYYMKSPHNSSYYHRVPGTDNTVTGAAAAYSGEFACGYNEPCTGYRVAFISNGRIYSTAFRDGAPTSPSVPPDSSASAVEIGTAGWVAANPTIVDNNGTTAVAWDESSGSVHRIAFRQLTAGAWSATTYFWHSTHVAAKPVLGIDYSCSPNTLNLVWECGNHIGRAARALSGTAWSPVLDLGPGRSPSIPSWSTQGAPGMWARGTIAPYSMDVSSAMVCADVVAPAATTNLAVDYVTSNTVGLTWTAPGDDGNVGQVVGYDVRYALTPIVSEATFAAAASWGGPSPTHPSGGVESIVVSGLQSNATYWFALKAVDESGNWSPRSNTADGYPFVMCPNCSDLRAGGDSEGRAPANAALSAGGSSPQARLAIHVERESGGQTWVVKSGPAAVGVDSTQGAGASPFVWMLNPAPPVNGTSAMGITGGIRTNVSYVIDASAAGFVPRTRARMAGDSSSCAILTSVVRHRGQSPPEALPCDGEWVPMAAGDSIVLAYRFAEVCDSSLDDAAVVVWGELGTTLASGAHEAEGGKRLVELAEYVRIGPNPAAESIALDWATRGSGPIKVDLFDVQGRLVRRLYEGWTVPGERHASLDLGRGETRIQSGVYICRVTLGQRASVRKLVVMRGAN